MVNEEYINLLEDILYKPKHARNLMDEEEFAGIILPLIKIKGYSVYIYGYDILLDEIILYMHHYGVKVKGIIDKHSGLKWVERWDAVPYLHISKIDQIPDPENAYIVVSVLPAGIEYAEIIKTFHDAGIDKICILSSCVKNYINGSAYHMYPRIEYFRQHYEELKNVLLSLKDTESKKVMLEYIRACMQCDTYRLPDCDGMYKYHYGKTLESGEVEQLYIHKKDEVWLNCGACFGDTIFHYFANGFDAETIFAVEADKERWEKLCQNIKSLPLEYQEKVVPANIFIDETTNFQSLFSGKPISLVNADIEGGELDLLKDLSEIIVNDRPVLAICAYHKASDLTDLIPYLQSIVDGYSYIIRKYPSYFYWEFTELVIYAIPDERLP